METNTFTDSVIYNLSESIEYSKDSVVSKIISKNSAGNLTLFAFDKGQGLSEHSAPFNAIVQIIDGTAEIIINKKPNILNKGQFIIMPANVPHALNAIEKFKMLLIMIKG